MQSDNYSVQQYDTDNLIWYSLYQELLEYKKQHGHCNVPSTYENQTLFQWVNQQRDDYAKLNMSDERINMLNTIGFDWNAHWNGKFEELKQYKSKHGNCDVPKKYNKNRQLYNWVRTQRSYFKHSKLSVERINVLNSIGFTWSISKNSFWIDKFEELNLYKSKHGDCNVPSIYEENQPLAYWVHKQRTQFTHSTLSEERINMLNTIGFNWGVRNKFWNDNFEQLKSYKSKHGDCNVPQKYDENQPLATWVHKQRFQFKRSKLSEERINMLNSIGFSWGAPYDKVWNDRFEQLKKYQSKYGDCNIPQKYDENQPLAFWVQTQRSQFTHSKLSEERIKMLNTIGFNWGVSKASAWNNRLKQLNLYKSKNGDCNVPRKYDENQPLAYWVHKQRFQFKRSKLSEERINMLNTIGFSWTVPKRMDRSRQHQDSKEKEELAFGDEIDTAQEDINIERNFDSEEKKTTTKEEENEIDTEREDTEVKGVEENHEQIVIGTSYQHAKEKEMTTKEKGETSSYKRSLQDRVQVLCKISLMFQEQKDVIHADMKRRKLGNSA